MLHDTKSNFEEETLKFNFFSSRISKHPQHLILSNMDLSFFNFKGATVTFRYVVAQKKKRLESS